MTRLDDARAKRRPRLAVVAFIASMFVLLITALIKHANVPDDIPARLAAARLPELVPPSSLLYLRVFMLAINLWAILLKLQMIEDKVIFHSPESQLPRRVEIRLSGFMWCSFFTFQAWALQTFYLAGALASSMSAVYGTPDLGARLPVALWFAFEVSFAVAVLTSFIVKYVLIPRKVQNGASVAGFFGLPDLLMHNCNTLFMALELLFADLPVLLSHFPLAALWGLFYVVFSWGWLARHGVCWYEFLDPSLPKAIVMHSVVLGVLGVFFAIGAALAAGAATISSPYVRIALVLVGVASVARTGLITGIPEPPVGAKKE